MDTITIDARMLSASGIGTYIQNLVPEIISAYKNIKFNVLGNRSDLQQSSFAGKANVSLIDCDSPVYSVTEQFEFSRRIPKGTTLLWSPHYNVPLIPTSAQKRLVTIHDVFHLAFSDQLNLRQKTYARLMLNAAVRLSNKIVTVSNFSKTEIMKYTKISSNKISVIHNGINIEQFKVLRGPDINHTKIKYGLPEKFILFVGNIKPHKNLKRLLVAYEKLYKQDLKDYGLVMVGKKDGFITGDNELFRILKNKSALQERVLFTGSVETAELSAIYNSASMLVFPSLYEGFGLPPLEAMACGCPVIVSNTASLSEVYGDAAYYVDPYNPESIAEGIHKLLYDKGLRQGLIQKGFKRTKMFTWKNSVEKHMNIFEEVINS